MAQFLGDAKALNQMSDLKGCMNGFSYSGRLRLRSSEKQCLQAGAEQLTLLASGLILIVQLVPEPHVKALAIPAAVIGLSASALGLLASDPPDLDYQTPVKVDLSRIDVPQGGLSDKAYAAAVKLSQAGADQQAYARGILTALNRASTAEARGATQSANRRAKEARTFASLLAKTLRDMRESAAQLSEAAGQDAELNKSQAHDVSAGQLAQKQAEYRQAGKLPESLAPVMGKLHIDAKTQDDLLASVLAKDAAMVARLGEPASPSVTSTGPTATSTAAQTGTPTTTGTSTTASTPSTSDGPTSGSTEAETQATVVTATLTADIPEYAGVCPKRITFSGQIDTTEPGVVAFQFVRSDGTFGTVRTIRFIQLRTYAVTDTWSVGEPGTTFSGWEAIRIVQPAGAMASASAIVRASCTG